MIAISIRKLEEYWLSKFDEGDLYAKNLLYRYLQYTKNLRKLQTNINTVGIEKQIENGKQSFSKPNPVLKEMRDLEKEIQKLEKQLLGLVKKKEEKKAERMKMI